MDTEQPFNLHGRFIPIWWDVHSDLWLMIFSFLLSLYPTQTHQMAFISSSIPAGLKLHMNNQIYFHQRRLTKVKR